MHSDRAARRAFIAGLMLAAAFSTSCSKPQTRYVHPNADLGAIQKVAVLPFQNMSTDPSAGEKVHSLFLVELLSKSAFEVIEPGQVTKVLRAERVPSTEALGPADFKKLGEQIGADGFFLGTIVEFGDARSGSSSPQVTIQLSLVEAPSGATVWSTSDSSNVSTFWRRLSGAGGRPLTEVARDILRRALDSLLD